MVIGKIQKKMHQGVISIGKAFSNLDYLLVDEKLQIISEPNKEGELCIAGNQVTDGYWQDPEKNTSSFFKTIIQGKTKRFYRSGDLCYRDEEGDYMYIERIDFQIKIGGYRIELGEIEFCATQFLKDTSVIAIDFINQKNITEIGLCIVGDLAHKEEALKAYLKEKLPTYMIPTTIKYVPTLPLNLNGKINRTEVKQIIAS